MQKYEYIERISYEAVEDLRNDNVQNAEIRFAPLQHLNEGTSPVEIVKAACAGLIEGEKDSIGKYVVLYFYPKDDTPGCTIETNDFNKLLSKFKKLDCEVYGVSKDNLKSHNKFKEKYKIKFDLLADEDLKVLKKYKVWGYHSSMKF